MSYFMERKRQKNITLNFCLFSYRTTGNEYWMGMYKDNPSATPLKSGWRWLDGRPFDTTLDLWKDTEPTGWHDDYCAKIGPTKEWMDYNCYTDTTFSYICKK